MEACMNTVNEARDGRRTGMSMRQGSEKVGVMTRGVCAALFAAAFAMHAHGQVAPDYDFRWSTIAAPGNVAYHGPEQNGIQVEGRGSVDYVYRMSTLEVSSGQWLEFLNTFSGTATPPRLFDNGNPVFWGGGVDGNYNGPGRQFILHPSLPNAAQLPVGGISYHMGMLYSNWLHNGKSSNPESLIRGAYDTLLVPDVLEPPQSLYPTHMPGAMFWMPTLDEWIKAAHFDPNRYGENQAGWWTYRNKSEAPGVAGPPGVGTTSAGWEDPNDPLAGAWHIPLGAYPNVVSPWGLLDTSGGASEWTEEIAGYAPTDERWALGPPAGFGGVHFGQFERIYSGFPENVTGSPYAGLRIVSAVPSPTILSVAWASLLYVARRRPRKGSDV